MEKERHQTPQGVQGDLKYYYKQQCERTSRREIEVADPHEIKKGRRPNSITYSRRFPDGTVYAIEQQVKGKNLSFRTLWKQVLGGKMVIVWSVGEMTGEDEE